MLKFPQRGNVLLFVILGPERVGAVHVRHVDLQLRHVHRGVLDWCLGQFKRFANPFIVSKGNDSSWRIENSFIIPKYEASIDPETTFLDAADLLEEDESAREAVELDGVPLRHVPVVLLLGQRLGGADEDLHLVPLQLHGGVDLRQRESGKIDRMSFTRRSAMKLTV